MYQHIEQFQSVMKENEVKASILRLPQNLVLFSQYWPRNANSYLFIPAEGEAAVIVPLVEKFDAERVGLHNIYTYNDVDMAAGDCNAQIIQVLMDLAKSIGIGSGDRIGIEMDYDVIAPCFCSGKVSLVGCNTKKLYADGLGSDAFINVKDMITDIMAIKNEEDIVKLEAVNSLMKETLDYFEELINKPGIKEVEVVNEVEKYFQIHARDYRGAAVGRAWCQLSTGEKGDVASCEGVISDNRVLEKGDCCLLEVGASLDGYWCDITRSAVVGGAEGQTAEMMDLIEKSFAAGLAAVKPGASGRDIDLATRKVVEDAGYGKQYLHPAGHGVGFQYHEAIPELNPDSTDVLKENMVIAIEPGLYVKGLGGLRKELNVLVTKEGGKILGA